jgi:uncharacterized membrane protein YraQ (UPF0718 family)
MENNPMSECCVSNSADLSSADQKDISNKKLRSFLPLLFFPPGILLYLYLERFVDFTIYSFLGMDRSSHLTEAIRFFVFEVPKVLMLLTVIVFIVGIIRSYFSPEKTRQALKANRFLSETLWRACLAS